jgi:hypothetical protein
MSGHRERLRKRFLTAAAELSEVERVELLLTYAIPRRDVAPLAKELLDKFGSVDGLLAAPYSELTTVKGIGEQVATLLRVVAVLLKQESKPEVQPIVVEKPSAAETPVVTEVQESQQPALMPSAEQPVTSAKTVKKFASVKTTKPPKQQTVSRTFTNDLAQAALDYVPMATQFETIESYKAHLLTVLPYNSDSSRKRYASNLINRYFSAGLLKTPMIQLMGYEKDPASRQAILFYETVKVEDTLRAVAEKSIWPALPAGKIAREQLRNFLISMFNDITPATMQRMLYSIFNIYTILNGARADQDTLHFQIRKGTLPAFLYILCAEFPEPGIYTMSALEAGPMRRWLLWDRDWMRRQLYNLQDLGVLAKVSEIDTIRQFTLTYSQVDALHHYYRHPQRTTIALREKL